MFARIVNNVVAETYEPPIADPATGTRFQLAECFHPEVAAQFVPCPDGIVVGSTFNPSTGAFTAPVAPPPAPVMLPQLTPMQFYLAFTPAERIAIKASTDPMVKEFWGTYTLAAQLNHPIDPNLISVQEGLAYLATSTTASPPGPGILASQARVTAILAGTAQ